MKNCMKNLAIAAVVAIGAVGNLALAAEPTTYILTVTNGSAMPLSPFAIYTQNGQISKANVGTAPTNGFIQLCQTGNPMTRVQELGMNSDVTFRTQTTSMLMPGESRSIEIQVQDPLNQSIQFETMYGKTKDVCALGAVGSHSLYALKQHVTANVVGKDDVVQTGAFSDPAIPAGRTYLDPQVCSGVPDAISCLRSLSMPTGGNAKIRFFSGYLSSLTMLLETKYGASETLSLLFPTSGAVRFDLKLKH